jgi:hypothetical protein
MAQCFKIQLPEELPKIGPNKTELVALWQAMIEKFGQSRQSFNILQVTIRIRKVLFRVWPV